MINIKENNNNFEQHQRILDKIHETYIQKNNAYGNSFDESCDDFGVTAAVVRLSDKFNRLKTLTKNPDISAGDESVMDTLLDMANYAILTYMWLENQKPKSGRYKWEDVDYVPHCKKCKYSNVSSSDEPCSFCANGENYEERKPHVRYSCIGCKYIGVSSNDEPCSICVEHNKFDPLKTCKGCIYDGGTFCNKSAEDPCFEHDGYTPKEKEDK